VCEASFKWFPGFGVLFVCLFVCTSLVGRGVMLWWNKFHAQWALTSALCWYAHMLVVVIAMLCCVSNVVVTVGAVNEPFSLVQPSKLWGLFEFDDLGLRSSFPSNNYRYVSVFLSLPIQLEDVADNVDDVCRYSVSGVSHGAQLSFLGYQQLGLYLDGKSYLEIPINYNPSSTPRITVGGWIKQTITVTDESSARCDIRHSFARGVPFCHLLRNMSEYCSGARTVVTKTDRTEG
jgi:hypothetical protein